MNYGRILSRSWEIIWNNKVLWLFGFLAGLAAGGGSNISSDLTNWFTENGNNPEAVAGRLENMDQFLDENVAIIAAAMFGFVGLIFVISIAFGLLAQVARVGLIQGVADVEQGAKSLAFKPLFRIGLNRLLRIVGLILMLVLPILVFLGIILGLTGLSFSLLSDGGESIGLVIMMICLMLCVLMPLSVFINFVQAFAFRGIVLRDLGVMESLKHGWSVAKANFGDWLLLGFMFFVISIAISWAAGLILIPLAFLTGAGVIESLLSGNTPGFGQILRVVMGGVVMSILLAVLQSVVITWQSSAFTLAYLEMTSELPGKEKTPEMIM